MILCIKSGVRRLEILSSVDEFITETKILTVGFFDLSSHNINTQNGNADVADIIKCAVHKTKGKSILMLKMTHDQTQPHTDFANVFENLLAVIKKKLRVRIQIQTDWPFFDEENMSVFFKLLIGNWSTDIPKEFRPSSATPMPNDDSKVSVKWFGYDDVTIEPRENFEWLIQQQQQE